MEEFSNAPMMPSASRNGFFLGIALIILQIIIQTTNLENQTIEFILTLTILCSGIFLSIRNYRDKFNQGAITYRRSIGYGTLISFLSGMISACFVYILLKYIEPSLMDKIIIASEENIEKTFTNQAEQEKMLAMNRNIINPGTIALGSIINNLIIGLVLSLIMGFFTKKELTGSDLNKEITEV